MLGLPYIVMSSSHLLNEWSMCRSIGKSKLCVLFQKLYARLSTKTNRIANCNIPNFISCITQDHMIPILPERSSHIFLKAVCSTSFFIRLWRQAIVIWYLYIFEFSQRAHDSFPGSLLVTLKDWIHLRIHKMNAGM